MFRLKILLFKGKLHSKIISSDMIEFFSAESDGEGPRPKFEGEDGQTDGGKLARASICDVMVPHWCHTAVLCMGCHFIYNNGGRGRFSWQRVGNRSPKAVWAGPRRIKFDTFSCDNRLLFSWFRWVEGL